MQKNKKFRFLGPSPDCLYQHPKEPGPWNLHFAYSLGILMHNSSEPLPSWGPFSLFGSHVSEKYINYLSVFFFYHESPQD